MRSSVPVLTPSKAARRLGVSIKALRLYEERGLIEPPRSAAGWRVFGAPEMIRAAEIIALRRLGLSLTRVKQVLSSERQDREPVLAAHQTTLEKQMHALRATVEQVRSLRAGLAQTPVSTVEASKGRQERGTTRSALPSRFPGHGAARFLR